MARQVVRVQLEQSDMRLILSMAKMANGGLSHMPIEQTWHRIKQPYTEVRDQKKQGVGFVRHSKVKVMIEWQPAMLLENHTNGCLPSQNGTRMNPQTRGRRNVMAATQPDLCRKEILKLTPWPPRTPPAPPGDNQGAQSPQSAVCLPDIPIYMIRLWSFIFWILMYMPMIASTIKISFLICWLMKEHPLVGILSAVWQCS